MIPILTDPLPQEQAPAGAWARRLYVATRFIAMLPIRALGYPMLLVVSLVLCETYEDFQRFWRERPI